MKKPAKSVQLRLRKALPVHLLTSGRFQCVSAACATVIVLAFTGASDRAAAPVEVGLTEVTPSVFQAQIEREGVVEALESTEVHSACYWSTTILSIVPEGTWVQKGDVVCVLDSSDIEDYALTREVLLIKYRGRLDNALHDEQMLKSQNDRKLATAEFVYQTADQSLNEYRNGKFPQQLEEMERNLSMLSEQEGSAFAEFQHIEKMWAMGLVSRREMEAGAFDLMKSQESHREAEASLRLMTDFTHPRSELNLEHRRSHALRSVARTKLANGLAATKARLTALSYERTIGIYERYYKRATDSIEACTLRAPCDGQVLYGNSWYLMSRGITQIEEGRTVRNRQKIFEIPDPDRLKISVAIDEALIGSVYHDMPVTITLPGYDDVEIAGRIYDISKYPRARSSYTPTVKDYWLNVEVLPGDEQRELLKPKSDAVVRITLSEQPDALQIPRSAVTGIAGHNFVYVYDGHEMVPRKVRLGDATEESVCVISGLTAGEQLVTEMTPQHRESLEQELAADLQASSRFPPR